MNAWGPEQLHVRIGYTNSPIISLGSPSEIKGAGNLSR